LTNANKGRDVYVLDTANNNAILGGFDIPGLDDYQQAGLAIDCEGHLWVVNQASQTVLEVESGETGACTWNNIPWLEVRPQNGKITGHTNQKLMFVFKGLAADPGTFQAMVMISNDSPYSSLTIPITLTVRRITISALPKPLSKVDGRMTIATS
jgi:hypothetical protein